MYVIGINDFNFIKITDRPTLYANGRLWSEIHELEYDAPLDEATIFKDKDTAEALLKEIQENVVEIEFLNNNIVGHILDKEHGFDKMDYSKKLKIYELIPTETEE